MVLLNPQRPSSVSALRVVVVGGRRTRLIDPSLALLAQVMWEILSVAVPGLGTVIADPFMSLVDTACVGQISATQLASLGPNTAIFNFVFQVRA